MSKAIQVPVKSKVKVTISHKGTDTDYTLRQGLGLQALAAAADTPIEFDCRAADCGICVVRVQKNPENLSEPTTEDRDFLKAMRADPDERLACQCRVKGDVTLLVDEY